MKPNSIGIAFGYVAGSNAHYRALIAAVRRKHPHASTAQIQNFIGALKNNCLPIGDGPLDWLPTDANTEDPK